MFTNYVIPALSIYTIWVGINHCDELSEEMSKNARSISLQYEEITKIKITELDPLWKDVQEQAWPPVVNLLTNDTFLTWIDDIRNLTLNAETVNTTTADTIKYFIDNIVNVNTGGNPSKSDVETTRSLQASLLGALRSISYKYDCYSDKIHAINILLGDCETGRDTFEVLYNDIAVVKNELNRNDCVSNDMIPYTSINEFRTILENYAEHNDFYSNCLLNSEDLLYIVCAEFLNGHTGAALVERVNKPDVTLDMVTNLLTRCVDRDPSPNDKKIACAFYCSNKPVSTIAESLILKESDIENIINETCGICDAKEDAKEICYEYYCKLENIQYIQEEVKLPSKTVEWVIANNCSKCIIEDTDDLKKICEENMCKGEKAVDLAADLGYPEYAIDDVIVSCNTILPDGCPPPTDDEKNGVKFLYCRGITDVNTIAGYVKLPAATVQRIIDNLVCD